VSSAAPAPFTRPEIAESTYVVVAYVLEAEACVRYVLAAVDCVRYVEEADDCVRYVDDADDTVRYVEAAVALDRYAPGPPTATTVAEPAVPWPMYRTWSTSL
jgi:hypothetical protein